MEERVLALPLERVQPNPDQPRKDFDEEELMKLARSIKATGRVMQPIVVRPIANERYEIIAGERRWRASHIATWYALEPATIRATVEDVDDETRDLMAYAENMVRSDLHFVEDAKALKRMLAAGIDWARIQQIVGVGDPDKDEPGKYLAWKVDVLDRCIPQVLYMMEQGVVGQNEASQLVKVSAAGQQVYLKRLNESPMTLQERYGLIEQIWANENASDMFEELKLSEEEQQAGRAFRSMLDRAIRAAEDVEKLEAKNPGALGGAMAAEIDVTLMKVRHLLERYGRIEKALGRTRGRLRAGGNGRPVKLPRVSDREQAKRTAEAARAGITVLPGGKES